MVSSSSNSRYTYIRDCKSRSSVEEHSVVVRNNVRFNKFCLLLRRISAPLLLLLFPFASLYLCLLLGNSLAITLWSFVLYGILMKLFLRKTVEKESVVVMPAFGVQLETHFLGGKVDRQFIPIDKILKPVLVERVTPVTCYWHLCLVVCDEPELITAFKRLQPPLKMLIPIWKSLCSATNQEASSNTYAQNDHQRKK